MLLRRWKAKFRKLHVSKSQGLGAAGAPRDKQSIVRKELHPTFSIDAYRMG